MIEFISYSGKYPCLCYGELVLRINGTEVTFDNCLQSGGTVWFDGDWGEHVDEDEWIVDIPTEYMQYAEEINRIVNENVPWGCCGGCI